MGKLVQFKRPPIPRGRKWRKKSTMPRVKTLILAVLIGGMGTQYYLTNGLPTTPTSNNLAASLSTVGQSFGLCGGSFRANCVVDGDTIWYGGVKIRILDIDAPEIHDYKCASELALGQRAKLRLLELMNAGPFEVIYPGGRDEDVYGRKLRRIERNGQSLGETLIAEGLASTWEGRHHSWCQ